MTSPSADRSARRIVLVPLSRHVPRPEASSPLRSASPPLTLDSRGDRPDAVRRYRLARLRLEPRDVPAPERFSHLKRQHD